MIGISTLTQNIAGAVIFETENLTLIRDGHARVSRSPTLDGADGGAVVNHLGFFHGDRTLPIYAKVLEPVAEALWDIFILGVMVNVSTDEGMYRAAIDSLTVDNGDIKMVIVIKESLTS